MSQIEAVFRWNGKEYSFDIRDAEDAEKFEKATEEIQGLAGKMPKDGKASVMIRIQCDAIKQFFATCLGEAAATEICGEKAKLDAHYQPYHQLCAMVATQRQYFTDSKNAFVQFSNRQQRRHPQNGQHHTGGKKYTGGKKHTGGRQ